MGPPRERGGVFPNVAAKMVRFKLQWGRRANAAECQLEITALALAALLQWGRRANAAEC